MHPADPDRQPEQGAPEWGQRVPRRHRDLFHDPRCGPPVACNPALFGSCRLGMSIVQAAPATAQPSTNVPSNSQARLSVIRTMAKPSMRELGWPVVRYILSSVSQALPAITQARSHCTAILPQASTMHHCADASSKSAGRCPRPQNQESARWIACRDDGAGLRMPPRAEQGFRASQNGISSSVKPSSAAGWLPGPLPGSPPRGPPREPPGAWR